MKINVVKAMTSNELEQKVNNEIKMLENQNNEIIDVKFSVDSRSMFDFYAMIIYKDLEV